MKSRNAATVMLHDDLFEAAGVFLTHVGRWSQLKAWGTRLAKRVGLRKARSPSPVSLPMCCTGSGATVRPSGGPMKR
jgi:hypothetical protein